MKELEREREMEFTKSITTLTNSKIENHLVSFIIRKVYILRISYDYKTAVFDNSCLFTIKNYQIHG